ncbi:MAG: DotI/IcmL family type IV secretion protein [Betaproteobacteria bacterium]|nr:DotI/IcmL family type IV secretion protein [Betaproteobacteria bacterium]
MHKDPNEPIQDSNGSDSSTEELFTSPDGSPAGLGEIIESDQTTEGEAASTLRENISLRKTLDHLRATHRRLWSAVAVQGVLLLFLSVGVVAVYPKYSYIATLDNQAVCEVSTEANPRVTPEVLTEFAKDATVDLYTYSFVDWREKINASVNKWMTDDGRLGFFEGLDSTGNLERVKKGRLILKAASRGVPQLEETGFDGATHFWIVRVPITLEFYTGQTDKAARTQNYIAAVKIAEVPPTARNVKGIAVKQIVLAYATAL